MSIRERLRGRLRNQRKRKLRNRRKRLLRFEPLEGRMLLSAVGPVNPGQWTSQIYGTAVASYGSDYIALTANGMGVPATDSVAVSTSDVLAAGDLAFVVKVGVNHPDNTDGDRAVFRITNDIFRSSINVVNNGSGALDVIVTGSGEITEVNTLTVPNNEPLRFEMNIGDNDSKVFVNEQVLVIYVGVPTTPSSLKISIRGDKDYVEAKITETNGIFSDFTSNLVVASEPVVAANFMMVAMTSPEVSVPAILPKEDLPAFSEIKSRWTMTDAANLGADSVGNNNLTVANNLEAGTGISDTDSGLNYGTGAHFSRNAKSHLFINDADQTGLDDGGAFTFSTWFKPEQLSIGISPTLISKYYPGDNNVSIRIRVRGDNHPELAVSASGAAYDLTNIIGDTQLQSDTWYHIVAVYDPGRSLAVYVNGVLDGLRTSGIPGSYANRNAKFVLGADENGGGGWGNLVMNDVIVWNKALSATQATQLYDAYFAMSADESAPPVSPFSIFLAMPIVQAAVTMELLESDTLVREGDSVSTRFSNGTPGTTVGVNLVYGGSIVQSVTAPVNDAGSVDVSIAIPNRLLPSGTTSGDIAIVMSHGDQTAMHPLTLQEGVRLILFENEIREGYYFHVEVRNAVGGVPVKVIARNDFGKDYQWNLGDTDGSGYKAKQLTMEYLLEGGMDRDGIEVDIHAGADVWGYKATLVKGIPRADRLAELISSSGTVPIESEASVLLTDAEQIQFDHIFGDDWEGNPGAVSASFAQFGGSSEDVFLRVDTEGNMSLYEASTSVVLGSQTSTAIVAVISDTTPDTPLHSADVINDMFFDVYGRNPIGLELTYYQNRLDKDGSALLGAMQYAFDQGTTVTLKPKFVSPEKADAVYAQYGETPVATAGAYNNVALDWDWTPNASSSPASNTEESAGLTGAQIWKYWLERKFWAAAEPTSNQGFQFYKDNAANENPDYVVIKDLQSPAQVNEAHPGGAESWRIRRIGSWSGVQVILDSNGDVIPPGEPGAGTYDKFSPTNVPLTVAHFAADWFPWFANEVNTYVESVDDQTKFSFITISFIVP